MNTPRSGASPPSRAASAPGWRALLACLGLGLLPLLPGGSRARELDPGEVSRRLALLQGTHAFRRILFDIGLRPVGSFNDLKGVRPGKAVVIALGHAGPLWDLPGGLERFVRRGGAVMVATDQPILNQEVAAELARTAGVSVNGKTVVCQSIFDFRHGLIGRGCYHGLDYCPFLQPSQGAQPDLFSGPQGGKLKVATNLPSFLHPKTGFRLRRVRPLAFLPPCCFSRDLIPLEEEEPLFAVGGDRGAGRILVLADHSIFINQMMLPDDTNNVEFAEKCLLWLAGERRQRNKVLLVEDGHIETRFDIPLEKVSIPPEKALEVLLARRNELLAEAGTALASAERQDAFNKSLFEWLNDLGYPPGKLAQAALFLLTLLLLLYGAYRLGVRARQRTEPTSPLLAQVVGGALPTAPILEQRHQALLRAGNLGEPAGQLARQWFASAGVAEADLGRPPRVHARGGWWQRRRLRRRVGRLWQLARGPAAGAGRVSPVAFRRLLGELEALKAALADGSLNLSKG
jgi:hypothetical protein